MTNVTRGQAAEKKRGRVGEGVEDTSLGAEGMQGLSVSSSVAMATGHILMAPFLAFT